METSHSGDKMRSIDVITITRPRPAPPRPIILPPINTGYWSQQLLTSERWPRRL